MKIGFVCLPLSGHVLPMSSLMRKLRSRGHQVVFIGQFDMGPLICDADLPFLPYCAETFPSGSMPGLWEPLARMHGQEILDCFGKTICPQLLDAALKELPHLLSEQGIDALVVDTDFFYVQLAAMSVHVPFVQVFLALHLDPTGTTPPLVFSWPFETTPEALARNRRGLQQLGKLHAPCLQIGRTFAERVKLSLDWTDPGAAISKLALITQTPRNSTTRSSACLRSGTTQDRSKMTRGVVQTRFPGRLWTSGRWSTSLLAPWLTVWIGCTGRSWRRWPTCRICRSSFPLEKTLRQKTSATFHRTRSSWSRRLSLSC